jgi:hypothetical protein
MRKEKGFEKKENGALQLLTNKIIIIQKPIFYNIIILTIH